MINLNDTLSNTLNTETQTWQETLCFMKMEWGSSWTFLNCNPGLQRPSPSVQKQYKIMN